MITYYILISRCYAALLKNHDSTVFKVFRQAFKIQIYCCNDIPEESFKVIKMSKKPQHL